MALGDDVSPFYLHDKTLCPPVLPSPSRRNMFPQVQMGHMGRNGSRHRDDDVVLHTALCYLQPNQRYLGAV
jgi:hypothetical protein